MRKRPELSSLSGASRPSFRPLHDLKHEGRYIMRRTPMQTMCGSCDMSDCAVSSTPKSGSSPNVSSEAKNSSSSSDMKFLSCLACGLGSQLAHPNTCPQDSKFLTSWDQPQTTNIHCELRNSVQLSMLESTWQSGRILLLNLLPKCGKLLVQGQKLPQQSKVTVLLEVTACAAFACFLFHIA